MPDVRTFQMVVELAERAATAGDYALAEAHLREAADLQEAEHGPLHPDLASTFNNLAVVCEMAEKAADAEQFYRRAHAIALATLPADHPLLATSRDNLRDFCAARGIPLEEWPPTAAAPAAEPPPPGPAPAPPSVTPAAAPERSAAPPGPRGTSSPGATHVAPPSMRRSSMWAVLVIAGLAALAAWRLWPDTAMPTTATEASAAATDARAPATGTSAPVAEATDTAAARDVAPPPTETTAAAPPTASAAPARPAAPAPATVPPVAAATEPAPPRPAGTGGREAAASTAGIRVVAAGLCRDLATSGNWRCTAAGAEMGPGRVSFYTRVASPRPVRLHHRWYQDGVVRQDVPLRVGANARDGYRTFSRQTVDAGEWRVELRTDDGSVLDAARVVVR